LNCSAPCTPNPFDVQTFSCYSTSGKVAVVFAWLLSIFFVVFLSFKIWVISMERKAKLQEKGIRPTLKRIIFFRSALSSDVSLQPLIHAQSDAKFKLSQPSPRDLL
jgi:hypothetical protein